MDLSRAPPVALAWWSHVAATLTALRSMASMHGLKGHHSRDDEGIVFTVGGSVFRGDKGPNVPDDRVDWKYGNKQVYYLIQKVMTRGKKKVAEATVYEAMDRIRQLTNEDPEQVIAKAFQNITPVTEVRTQRLYNQALLMPVKPTPNRARGLGLRWLVKEVRKLARKARRPLVDILTQELIDASNDMGMAVRRRDEMYRTAEASKVNIRT